MRAEMHSAVDQIIDRYLAMASQEASATQKPVPTAERPGVTKGEDISGWTYSWWASGGIEQYRPAWEYEVITPARTHHVVLGRTVRSAWGRDDRKRVIIFWQSGSTASEIFYPWTEFVETDDGRYAAPIPNPNHPRKIIT